MGRYFGSGIHCFPVSVPGAAVGNWGLAHTYLQLHSAFPYIHLLGYRFPDAIFGPAVLVEPNIGRPTLIGRSIYLFRETLNMNIHNHQYSYNIHDEITAGHSQGVVVSRARPIRYTKSRLCRDADCSLKWAGSIGVSQKSPSPFGI